MIQIRCPSHQISSRQIEDLAKKNYNCNGRGITYFDLIKLGVVDYKRQAQRTLKYHLSKGTLFTIKATRPQQYFPSSIRSNIIENQLHRNAPIEPSGVSYYSSSPNGILLHDSILNNHKSSRSLTSKHPLYNCLERLQLQTLEQYVLPLLPKANLFIHNLHLKLRIIHECYHELKLEPASRNNGKQYFEIIGMARADYTFYPNGTVNIEVRCSNHPFRLQSEIDRIKIFIFFGQLKDRLITFLMDKHKGYRS